LVVNREKEVLDGLGNSKNAAECVRETEKVSFE
jgi:hypothetical protein